MHLASNGLGHAPCQKCLGARTSPEMAWGTHLARNGLGHRFGSVILVSCSGPGLSTRSVLFRRYVLVLAFESVPFRSVGMFLCRLSFRPGPGPGLGPVWSLLAVFSVNFPPYAVFSSVSVPVLALALAGRLCLFRSVP